MSALDAKNKYGRHILADKEILCLIFIRNISGVADFPGLKSITVPWQTFLESNPFSLYDLVT
jgi:hypothetical protein